MQGYSEMIQRIEPSAIICYGDPFPEMKGNVIAVDYATTNHLGGHKKYWTSGETQLAPKPSAGYYVVKTGGCVLLAGYGGGGGGGRGKQRRGTPRNNQAQNSQTDDIARRLRLSPKQRAELHRLIHGMDMGYQEILEFAREWFQIFD